jgi:hypothetical protein
VRFRLRGTIDWILAEMRGQQKEIYTPRPLAAILFAFDARKTSQPSRAAIHWLRNPITGTMLGDPMAYDLHQRAAEFHMLAAHAHQAAAAHHDKEDHLTAHEQSRQAMEHASKAFELSRQAHDESAAIFKKHDKKG